jgi:hypothetical protein
LNAGRILRLLWYGAVLLVLAFACWLPFLAAQGLLPPHARVAYGDAVFVAVWTLLCAKFAFLCFLCEDEGARSFSLSWRLTSGRTFLPTLALSLLYVVPLTAFRHATDTIHATVPLELWTALRVFAYLALFFAITAYANPLFVRWMIACERFHPETPLGLEIASTSL